MTAITGMPEAKGGANERPHKCLIALSATSEVRTMVVRHDEHALGSWLIGATSIVVSVARLEVLVYTGLGSSPSRLGPARRKVGGRVVGQGGHKANS